MHPYLKEAIEVSLFTQGPFWCDKTVLPKPWLERPTLSKDNLENIRVSAEHALSWLVEEGLVESLSVQVEARLHGRVMLTVSADNKEMRLVS